MSNWADSMDFTQFLDGNGLLSCESVSYRWRCAADRTSLWKVRGETRQMASVARQLPEDCRCCCVLLFMLLFLLTVMVGRGEGERGFSGTCWGHQQHFLCPKMVVELFGVPPVYSQHSWP